MATQILRTVDRWRFETPLALVLAGAAGFAVLAMPHEIFARLPVAGHFGTPGHIAMALLLAILCGGIGYAAMRRPAKIVPTDDDETEATDELDAPSGIAEDRLLRLRRADRHPDAPPRAPIRASRDLGEPFMDVGAFVPPPSRIEPEAEAADPAIIDGDYVEVADHVEAAAQPELAAEDAYVEPVAERAPDDAHMLGKPFFESAAADEPTEAAPVVEEPIVEEPVVAAPVAAATIPPVATPRRNDESIAAMMERLSAGMERRANRPVAPSRDMRPALRDALDELNRLAARRG